MIANHTPAEAVSAMLNAAVGPGTASTMPEVAAVVVLGRSADPAPAVERIKQSATTLRLAERPIMLWHGPKEILVGPAGALDVTALMRDNDTLDVRIHTEPGQPARIVISWLDGPSREEVQRRLEAQEPTGLRTELVRERIDILADDVLAAVFDRSRDDRAPATHPVLDRVQAVRDGGDTYFDLLQLAARLLSELRTGDPHAYTEVRNLMLDLGNQEAVHAVLEDVDARIGGTEATLVHPVDEHAMLVALFVLSSAAARRR